MDKRWIVAGGAATAAVAVAVGVLMLLPRPQPAEPPTEGIGVPPRGGVVAAFAADARPIWVVRHANGQISVLDGLSSHVPFGVNKATWWCPATRTIEDPAHGSLYDEFGSRIAGPAPIGLGRYAYEIRDGRIVLDDAPPRAGGEGARPEDGQGCTPEEALTHDYTSLPEATSPADAAAYPDGWLRVRATLVPVPGQGVAHLCPRPADDDGCVRIALPGMEQFVAGPADLRGSLVESWTDANWLVHVVDGALVEISRVPEPAR